MTHQTLNLELRHISCERDDTLLFKGLSYIFHAGAVVQIQGENGAGKTTLLRIIAGLSDVYEGSITFNGSMHRSIEFYSSLLYLGHDGGVDVSLTPFENLRWYMGLNAQKISTKDMLDALQKVGLRGYEYTPCSDLSAGQKRRTSLARLYCSNALLWVLDEPFTAIDVAGVESLCQLFTEHTQRGGLLIVTSHQPIDLPSLQVLNLQGFKSLKKVDNKKQIEQGYNNA